MYYGYSYGLNHVSRGAAVDPDAQSFITAASITDATQQSAVNQLVLDLKAASIWTKMKAVYPFVGGSASSHAICLKRLTSGTFYGGFTHDSGGARGNGTNGYFDTGLAGNSGMGQDNYHASVYSRTDLINSDADDLAIYDSGFGCSMYTGSFSPSLRINSMGAGQVGVNYGTSKGFFFQSRYTTGNLIYGRDTDQNSISSTSANLKTSNWIGWRTGNYNGEYSSRYLGTITIGTGLNGTEITSLRNAVVNYNTALSRNV